MKMNVAEKKVMRISRQPSPVQIVVDQKHLANVEYMNCECLSVMITTGGRCTIEIKSRDSFGKSNIQQEGSVANWT
jgi:hypothetical protein